MKHLTSNPNLQGFFNNKLGVTFDQVGTHTHAGFGSATRALHEHEINQLNEQLTGVYQTFKHHVGEGRSMNQVQVEALAKGRIWSGLAAKQNGLVDELGGLHDAIQEAALMAKIDQYQLIKLPKEETPFNRFLGDAEDYARSWLLSSLFGNSFTEHSLPLLEHYKATKTLQNQQGIQARMPFSLIIE
jgi:protease-4